MAVAKSKAFLAVNVDTIEVSQLTGFITSLSAKIGQDVNAAPVLNYAHGQLSDRFDDYMSLISTAAPGQFHHVYDWNHIGIPQYQLWKNVIRGRGADKYASFEFRASKLPVPLPEGDKKPFRKKHRFIYKAMIMEYNIAVTIKPKRAKMLAFPIGDRVIFTKGPVFVENPGGAGTTGAFTAAWTNWWGGAGAEQVFNSDIKNLLENDLSEKAMARFIKRFKPARRKTIKLSVADNRSAFDNGARLAEEFLQERNRKNIARRKTDGEL
jgi:hypothetical protein